jgi:hypothetical protein
MVGENKYIFMSNDAYKIITKTPFSDFYKAGTVLSNNIVDITNNLSIDESGNNYIFNLK